jgi:hypothetical protein
MTTHVHAGHVDSLHEKRRSRIANHRQFAQSETPTCQANADVDAELVEQRGDDDVRGRHVFSSVSARWI